MRALRKPRTKKALGTVSLSSSVATLRAWFGASGTSTCCSAKRRSASWPSSRGSAIRLRISGTDIRDQSQEEPEPGSVGGRGVELESSRKQCFLIKAVKAFSLAFSRLSCSISLSSCLIRCA
jgi:hypothetical protein